MDSAVAAWPGPEAMASAMVVHFEVHVLHQGRWVIDCSGQEEAAVRNVAKEYAQRPEIMGVRLVKEMYNPSTDRAAARVLLEKIRPKREARRVFLASRPTAPAPAVPVASSPTPVRLPPAPALPTGGGLPVAALASIVVGFLLVVTLIALLTWR